MVLSINLIVGQYVEVKHRNQIVCGTVRYKGHLNGEAGEWIGVQLEYALGKHNGCWRGRTYFRCPANCGLFTHASSIRFRRAAGRSKDSYRKVRDFSYVDESLFFPRKANINTSYSVSRDYVERAKTSFLHSPQNRMFSKPENYALSHAVGRNIPAATMLRKPGSGKQTSYTSRPVHYEYAEEYDNFLPCSPSIPHYTMPHEALKRQLRRGGWEAYGLHRPRFISV